MNAPLPHPPQVQAWQVVDQLCARARQAETEAALLFVAANDGHALLPYRSALVFTVQGGQARFACQSGLTTVDRRSPFGGFGESVVQALLTAGHGLGGPVHRRELPEALHEAWSEYWPEQVWAFAMPGADDSVLGVVLYVCDQPWPELARPMWNALHQAYGLSLQNLRGRRRAFEGLRRLLDGRSPQARRYLWGAVVLVALALCVPVRQFVVAPAEIVSLDAVAVTSPVEGIVAELVARPNQAVRKGDVLVRLDDTAIRNRLASARQGLEVARAEYLAGAHRAFVSSDRAAEAGVLKGRINERLAEVAFLQEQLAMQEIRALRDGIAVYGQESDWIGKPVAAGQRLMELADALKLGVQVWVPVADAINLEQGARLTVLLYADPLHPLAARIEQAGYQATRSPDGVAAYRVRARLDSDNGGAEFAPRLGLRGSAKIDGQWVPLGYFLLRRPLGVVRQYLGV